MFVLQILFGANSQQIQLITNSSSDGRDALATSVTTSDLTKSSSKNDLIGSTLTGQTHRRFKWP